MKVCWAAVGRAELESEIQKRERNHRRPDDSKGFSSKRGRGRYKAFYSRDVPEP